jgi:hypothetical protein
MGAMHIADSMLNVSSLSFFDPLEPCLSGLVCVAGIVVGPEGYIRKCLDEDYEGLLVSQSWCRNLSIYSYHNLSVVSSMPHAPPPSHPSSIYRPSSVQPASTALSLSSPLMLPFPLVWW